MNKVKTCAVQLVSIIVRVHVFSLISFYLDLVQVQVPGTRYYLVVPVPLVNIGNMTYYCTLLSKVLIALLHAQYKYCVNQPFHLLYEHMQEELICEGFDNPVLYSTWYLVKKVSRANCFSTSPGTSIQTTALRIWH